MMAGPMGSLNACSRLLPSSTRYGRNDRNGGNTCRFAVAGAQAAARRKLPFAPTRTEERPSAHCQRWHRL